MQLAENGYAAVIGTKVHSLHPYPVCKPLCVYRVLKAYTKLLSPSSKTILQLQEICVKTVFHISWRSCNTLFVCAHMYVYTYNIYICIYIYKKTSRN